MTAPRSPGLSQTAVVTSLYKVILGREPDLTGLEHYAAALREGRSTRALAAELLASAEFRDRPGAVLSAHELLCVRARGRFPSESEASRPLAVLAAELVADPAIGARAPSVAAHRVTAALLYPVVLGRGGDPGGVAFYADALANGRTPASLAADMIRSDEFVAALQGRSASARIVLRALGREPTALEAAQEPEALAARLLHDPAVRLRFPAAEALHGGGLAPGDPAAYADWLAEQRWRRAQTAVPPWRSRRPLLSAVLLVEDGGVEALRAALAPFLEQRAAAVELLVALRGQGEAEVAAALRTDTGPHRLRALSWPSPRTAASLRAEAMRLARGRFLALIDPRDGYALDLVRVLAAQPDGADILLSDGDRPAAGGGGRVPVFGAAWDPDLAMTAPPPGLVLVRTGLAREVAGHLHPRQPEGDLLLRAAARTRPDSIRRIPAVLRHRADPGLGDDDDAEAWRQVVQAALERAGTGARAVTRAAGRPLRVVHPLPAPAPLASIIVPTRDRLDLLRPCLEGLLARTDYPALEVLVMDNDSRDEATSAYLAAVARDPRVRVLAAPGAFNWAALNNAGLAAMRGTVAVLLNNDVEVIDPGWLGELVAQALRPDVGIAGAKLLYPDGTVQHAGVVLGPAGRAVHVWRHAGRDEPLNGDALASVRTTSALTGACMAIRRAVFDRVGGFDAENLKVTWNDTDLCLRVRAAGYRLVFTPHACLVHRELASRGPDDRPDAARRLERERRIVHGRWGGALEGDPYFSPNLDACDGTPRLSAAPRLWPASVPRVAPVGGAVQLPR